MHAVIINGSPRAVKNSNTEKIIDAFAEGLSEAGMSSERYAISNRNNWDAARRAYSENSEIIFAVPLYVENVPGILLEFLETLPVRDRNTRVSFILQGGFAEASQLDCGAKFLQKLPAYLGTDFGGVLIKGDNFGIRFMKEEDGKKIAAPYKEMGKAFVRENGFRPETVKKFAGPEYFSLPMRLLLGLVFRTFARKRFETISKELGCTVPIDNRPWA